MIVKSETTGRGSEGNRRLMSASWRIAQLVAAARMSPVPELPVKLPR